MSDKEDYLTCYRVFFENFAATVNPEDQLPVQIAGYTITESELPGEVLYWTTQYLSEKQCPLTLMTPLRRQILEEVRIAAKKFPNEFGYKSDESVYIALRLMQAVTAVVNNVCLRYLDNARLDTLPPPPPPAQRDLKTVSCATKNSRRVMEDRHVEIGNLEALFGIEATEPTSFYAVYDGHAGSAAATYCAAHLHQYLVESPHFTNDLTRAMRDAFLRTDVEFIRKSNQDRANGGSTAVAVCVRGKSLLAAWAGDSLALLAKRMRLMQLVRPHKPSREDERDRIEASGGTVMYWGTWRVNGQLAVSRAIGDAQYKPYVTARPEIATVDLDGDEDFVVVACDGLWDFVSEDEVALSVYRQIAADPDDLKAVTKRLIVQAKRQGSADNISIIVVFLKDPRDIAADNCPPMDLGLDNALANAPPFAGEPEACKRQVDAATAAADADGDADADAEAPDNGVDNSDSDSEDLGPETAVDVDDIDADARMHEPAAPTPPAHTVEAGHVEEPLVDNVAESGDESEDEWNYYKGEGERDENNPSEEPDEPPLSETPCQDNSAWESSSVDMNSSPLNPDAPVFIPGGVAGSDVLLAESPRKPLPMDDIELPDVAQFKTGAEVRPAELLDLDNCDQLNGHHNVSIDSTGKEHLNGNEKCDLDSLGFGFNVGIEPDKVKDTALIQDFERIQKDTTDFCNIQVFQTQTETNPFAVESNDELFERLKNKERDPMSMSFYQEKDDDTCERLAKNESHIDLNAVQPLPDSDDEELQNGVCDLEGDKENISPPQRTDPFGDHEPNNDIMRFDDRADLTNNMPHFGQGDNCMQYNATNTSNLQSYPNIDFETGNIPQDTVLQTDTPESHKLLFEQIPEIPDGKSSELGFTNDDIQDRSESEKDVRVATPQDETSQDVEMDSKMDDSPSEEQPQIADAKEEQVESERILSPETIPLKDNEILSDIECISVQQVEQQPEEKIEDVNLQQDNDSIKDEGLEMEQNDESSELVLKETDAPEIRLEDGRLTPEAAEVAPAHSPLPIESPAPTHSPLPTESPAPTHSPLPTESPAPAHSPLPTESPAPAHSPLPTESPVPAQSPLPTEIPLPSESPRPVESPIPVETQIPTESPIPAELSLPVESPVPAESPSPAEDPVAPSPAPQETLQALSPAPATSPLPAEPPTERSLPHSPVPAERHEDVSESALPAVSPVAVCDLPVVDVMTELPVKSELVEPAAAIEYEKHESPAPAEQLEDTEKSSSPNLAEAPEAATDFASLPKDDTLAPAESLVETTTPEAVEESAPHSAPLETAPAPDLVPELRAEPPAELRATEICVPVTSEIRPEDGEQPLAAGTPPPTPAVDAPAPEPLQPVAVAAAGAAVAAVAATAVAATATSKTKAPAKKPTTPATKSTDARTPRSAPKPSGPAARTPTAPAAPKRLSSAATPARTPGSATKPVAARTPTAAPRATPPAAAKSGPKTAAPKALPAARPAAPKSAPAKPAAAAPAPKPAQKAAAPSAPKPAPSAPRAAAPRPTTAARPAATRPAAPRPATAPAAKPAPRAPTTSSRPAPRAAAPAPRPAPTATAAARPKPKPASTDKKPLTNGDVKEIKPNPARPQPRAAPPSTRPAAPKPASRAAPLDKQSKDLANKRITAKAAPPRTGPIKAPPGTKTAVPKSGVKKVESPMKESTVTNGVSNGTEAVKAPPSPALDNALLPDVIA